MSQRKKNSIPIEDIIKGKDAFVSFNINRLRELFRYLSPKKLELFRIIPFLLHVNVDIFPGYNQDNNVPHGIVKFQDSGFFKFAVRHFKIPEKDLVRYYSYKNHIRGLYLMGSSGTLAQTEYSDFDYWVLVDQSQLDDIQLTLLYHKLTTIEKWSYEKYGQQVNFFVMDVEKIKNNEFASVDEESSGSAQKTLLKEEFYRTFILIAGQIPFWSIFPVGLEDEEYNRWVNGAYQTSHRSFYADDCIDLGNLHAVDTEECLGAIYWQIYKARSDPVKSMLKATVIAFYHFFQDTEGVLCNILKKKYPERILDGYQSDPYVLVFETAIQFYSMFSDEEGLEVVRECIFLRLNGYPLICPPLPGSPKEQLFHKYLEQWGWDREKLKRFENYAKWSEQEKLEYEKKILNRLSFIYQLVVRSQEDGAVAVKMDKYDLQILINRIASTFQKKPGKLPRCSVYLKSKASKHDIYIICEQDEISERMIWRVADRQILNKTHRRSETTLFKGPELLCVLGWMALNELNSKGLENIHIESLGCGMIHKRVKNLYHRVLDFIWYQDVAPNNFLADPKWCKILVVLDNITYGVGRIIGAEILIVNSWNEVSFDTFDLSHLDNVDKKCYMIAQTIKRYMEKSEGIDFKFRVYLVKEKSDDRIVRTIDKYLTTLLRMEDSIDTDDFDQPFLDLL